MREIDKNELNYSTEIIDNQCWNGLKRINYTKLINGDVAYSFSLDEGKDKINMEEYVNLCNVYIQPLFRGKKLFYQLMEKVEELSDGDIYLTADKNSFIYQKYLNIGYEYYDECDDEKDWLYKKKGGN